MLDASALLALLLEEAGAARVEALLAQEAHLCTVNLAEVVGRAARDGISANRSRAAIAALPVKVVAFDEAMAAEAGRLEAVSRPLGLSLGDRSCLAAAKLLGATAVTADRSWLRLDAGIAVETIR